MKLKECLDIGKACGLHTWEECYDNIYLHSTSIFEYDEINKEILELQKDMFFHDSDKFCRIFNSNKENLVAKGWKIHTLSKENGVNEK